jgi:aspartate aminotransferase-like enzyme
MKIDLRNSYFSVSDSVRESLSSDFTDHRSESFLRYIESLEKFFCLEFNIKYCTFVQGSGTLANEIMVEEIEKSHPSSLGIILNHGEFGQRLVDSCKLRSLEFSEISDSYSSLYDVLQRVLEKNDDYIKWILFPLCESSTGVIYDLNKIKSMCRERRVKIYIDGMSYIGSSTIDLSGVEILTGSSGKGLGSIPGIGILLHSSYSEETGRRKYLDLNYYHKKDNIPFTISSVQIKALGSSSRERLCKENFNRVSRLREYIFEKVKKSRYISLEIENQEYLAFFSLKVDSKLSSKRLGEFLESRQIFLSFRTSYLIVKNCIEISLLDLHTEEKHLDIFFSLVEYYGENHSN